MAYLNDLTPADVRINADHLRAVSDETIQTDIDDAYALFIAPYSNRIPARLEMSIRVVHKLLAQHLATLNVRRADSEAVAGMSKSISVPKDQDLDLTEYGQMARKVAEKIPLPWADKDKPACLVIY